MGTVSTTLPSDGQTIDAADVNTPINAILSEFNGNIDDDNIKTGANINGSKLAADSIPATKFDTDVKGGWVVGELAAPNTITHNGNRSYTLTFNSVDYSDELSPGMRLRTTRTTAAPDQCADLESSSSQYFSKSSPTGITFTDDFTCMAWIKLESYTGSNQMIVTNKNGAAEGWGLFLSSSGELGIEGEDGSSNVDIALSYQSIPLGRWVHVAGTLNISGTSGAVYIDGVEVPSSFTNGGGSALVQHTSLEIGSRGGGSLPFDGKIAQVAVFDAVLSQASIRDYMTHGLSGSETNCVAAYSLDNDITDLTSNNNDLTANGGAVATDTDSPFGDGGTSTTLDYGIVTAVAYSTNTDVTVQVPEGCTIPTSGGVSAVAYSTQSAPFGFPTNFDPINNPDVSFFGYTTQTVTTSTQPDITVYNTQSITSDNSFDPETGVFTAPYNGWYQLSSHQRVTDLAVDKRIINTLIIGGSNGASLLQTSVSRATNQDPGNTITMNRYLLAGDTAKSNTFHDHGSNKNIVVHFSGSLIRRSN